MRSIPGLEGYYHATETGEIYSVRSRRVLKACKTRLYPCVTIYIPGKPRQTRDVHALVALAYHGLTPSGMEISHVDHDPTNNRPENLVFETHRDNRERSRQAGRRDGTQNPNFERQLTADTARLIRAGRYMGHGTPALAKRFNTTPQNADRVASFKNWKAADPPEIDDFSRIATIMGDG